MRETIYIFLLKKWAIKQKIRKDRNKAKKTDRPSTPEYVVDIILSIKKENQGYSIDFWGNQMFILNIIHHGQRRVIRSIATYNPSALWVAQQIREAFPYDTAPKMMVMDRDTIFSLLVKHTLPNMGIQVRRIDYKSPSFCP